MANYELVTLLATLKSVMFSCTQVIDARNSFKVILPQFYNKSGHTQVGGIPLFRNMTLHTCTF